MYESYNDVPDVIKEFYHEVVRSEPTGNQIEQPFTATNEKGEEVTGTRLQDEYADVTYIETISRPETKVQADLDRVIGLGKPESVISKFADLVANGIRWDWFDAYLEWQVHVEEVRAYNDDLPVIGQTEEGEDIYAEPRELPTEPVKPVFPTGSEVLAPYVRELFKKDRSIQVAGIKVTVDGMVFDGDEESQTRMARAIVTLEDGERTLWVLADNTPATPTKEQLKQALRLSGELQASMWTSK